MNRHLFLKQWTLILLFFSCITILSSQVTAVPFSQRVQKSERIALAQLVEKHSYWDNGHRNIYTLNVFNVHAYLKDETLKRPQKIAVIMGGGIVGDMGSYVCPSRDFDIGTDYVVMLDPDNNDIDDKTFRALHPEVPQSEAYASVQGVLGYHLGKYYDMLVEQPMTEIELFDKFKNAYNLTPITPQNAVFKPRPTPQYSVPLATITSITDGAGGTGPFVGGTVPTTNSDATTANNELIINGTGFGTSIVGKKVTFDNVNDGSGGALLDTTLYTDKLQWSNTQIRVRIPSRAGTGTIGIIDSSVSETVPIATSSINIKWSEINVENTFNFTTDPTLKHRVQTKFANDNTLGGYTFNYSTAVPSGFSVSFDNSAASRTAFERSLVAWRCATLINFEISPTRTSIGLAASDGTNTVTYTNLSAGTLGRCTYFFNGTSNGGCQNFNTLWYISEIDVEMSPNYTWNYTTGAPTAGQYDFESVISHELGHGHGCSHINSSSKMMYFSISSGSNKRTISADESECALFKLNASSDPVAFCMTTVDEHTKITTGVCAILPIELLVFEGKQVGKNQINLTWKTASERDNKGFQIERSFDGKTFTNIGFVPSKSPNSGSQQNYQFEDTPQYQTASTVYYRLRQIDVSGAEALSKTLAFNILGDSKWAIYPNPTTGQINVKSYESVDKDVEIVLFDVLGQRILSKKISGTMLANDISLSIETLPNGLYWLKILRGQQTIHVERLVKN
jgi:hypothetical protein